MRKERKKIYVTQFVGTRSTGAVRQSSKDTLGHLSAGGGSGPSGRPHATPVSGSSVPEYQRLNDLRLNSKAATPMES